MYKTQINTIKKGSLALRLTLYLMDWQDCQTGQTMYQTIYKRAGAAKNLFFAKLLLIGLLLSPESVRASVTCKGSFVNPITDICCSCLMPISIGEVIKIGDKERSVITKHIRNIFKGKELEESVCAKFAHTALDDNTYKIL